MSIRSVVQEKVNNALRPMGVQMIRSRSVDPAIKTFAEDLPVAQIPPRGPHRDDAFALVHSHVGGN